jgi:VWFA-related protein
LRILPTCYEKLFVLTVLMGAFYGPKVLSQSADGHSVQGSVLKSESSLVVVPALVRTKAGEMVFTLGANDFVLTDDGIPQKLSLEPDIGGEPLALVVAIETGGAGAREFAQLGSLPQMLASVVGSVPHKIAVVSFDSHSELVQQFTADSSLAAEAIAVLTAGCSRRRQMKDCAAPGSVLDATDADNGAAILDSFGFAVDLLRAQPLQYRCAILLISETLDRGSNLKLGDAVRKLSDTNTTIYSIGFSTSKSEAAHYASRELPGSHSSPNPPHGCMGKDPTPDPDATHHKAVQAYDCLTQLAPPLALAKMATIAFTDGMRRNVPETVAHFTGGEYFNLNSSKSLEQSMSQIANHLPNRYMLSFQPQSPHAGLHALGLRLRDRSDFEITSRGGYWATPGELAQDQTIEELIAADKFYERIERKPRPCSTWNILGMQDGNSAQSGKCSTWNTRPFSPKRA